MKDKEYQKAEDEFRRYLFALNDGTMDVDALLNTEYGDELLSRLRIRTAIEQDPANADTYYASIGLKCEFHDPDDYYRRWKLFIPVNLEPEKKYPVIFWNHGGGNSIEAEEVMTGYLQLAAVEGYLLAMAQNTNQEKNLEILEYIEAHYPVDTGRVYLAGFSQGSQQAVTLFTHHPEKIAAAALNGTDIWRPWDNFDQVYTEEELNRLKELVVPMSLQVGACEPFAYAPLNFWHPNTFNRVSQKERGLPDDFRHSGRNPESDPTRITQAGKGRYDPEHPNLGRMASKYVPEAGEDIPSWSLECVNRRMDLLKCERRDVNRCISFLDAPEDELHHVCGIYADREEIREYLGLKHYVCNIDNEDNMNVFQYIVMENSGHWPGVTCAYLGWNFMKRFSRGEDGRLIQVFEEATI